MSPASAFSNYFSWAGNRSASWYWFILFVWIVAAIGFQTWRRGEVIRYDVSSYYSYLPAVFIHQNLSFSHLNPEDRFTLWYETLPDGRRYQRMTIGMAILYLPFFLLAHGTALVAGFEADGYSLPYAAALVFSGLFYAALGLWVLRKSLLDLFAPAVTDLTLLLIGLGTNLLYYTSMAAAYSHAFSFFLFALFFRLTVRRNKAPCFREVLLAGTVYGLMVLIRPTNALIALVPALYVVLSAADLRLAIRTVFRSIWIGMAAAVVVCLPQAFYWKYATGHWLFYTYHFERFFFLQPHVVDFLFSYRKGWLVYTPLMLFALAGFVFLYRRNRPLTLALLTFLLLHIYVASSWWSWWYGGSFGQRPMVETYALLAFPLAAFVAFMLKQRIWVRWVIGGLLAFCVWLNGFQTLQMRLGILHWDAMTREAYWHCFLRLSRPDDLDFYLQKPDLERAYQGLDERRLPFDQERRE